MLNQTLLEWYYSDHRQLPWRENHDPYRIWLSEIMLQQTQVITVIDYFNRFVARYPDVYALANADEADVMKLWEGLGYYSRARNLMKCARQVAFDHEGDFPQTPEALQKLAGIGPYTAGAIASIAFNKQVPAVDGNVMRVFSRVNTIGDDIGNPKNRKRFEEAVMDHMPQDARHFNQALMELGARICTPKAPSCDTCPINSFCQAFKAGNPTDYPVKLKKVKPKHLYVMMAVIKVNDTYCLMKQTERNLLRDLWHFPLMEFENDSEQSIEALEVFIEETFDYKVTYKETLGGVKHIYTHLVWHVTPIVFEASDISLVDYPMVTFATREEMEALALPTVMKKVLSQMSQSGPNSD